MQHHHPTGYDGNYSNLTPSAHTNTHTSPHPPPSHSPPHDARWSSSPMHSIPSEQQQKGNKRSSPHGISDAADSVIDSFSNIIPDHVSAPILQPSTPMGTPPVGLRTSDFLKARIKLAEDSLRKLHAATPNGVSIDSNTSKPVPSSSYPFDDDIPFQPQSTPAAAPIPSANAGSSALLTVPPHARNISTASDGNPFSDRTSQEEESDTGIIGGTENALDSDAEDEAAVWAEVEEARRRRQQAENDLAASDRRQAHLQHQQQQQGQWPSHAAQSSVSPVARSTHGGDDSIESESVALIMRVSMDHGVVDLVVPSLDVDPVELAVRFCREQGLPPEKVIPLAQSIDAHLDLIRNERADTEQGNTQQPQPQRASQQQPHHHSTGYAYADEVPPARRSEQSTPRGIAASATSRDAPPTERRAVHPHPNQYQQQQQQAHDRSRSTSASGRRIRPNAIVNNRSAMLLQRAAANANAAASVNSSKSASRGDRSHHPPQSQQQQHHSRQSSSVSRTGGDGTSFRPDSRQSNRSESRGGRDELENDRTIGGVGAIQDQLNAAATTGSDRDDFNDQYMNESMDAGHARGGSIAASSAPVSPRNNIGSAVVGPMPYIGSYASIVTRMPFHERLHAEHSVRRAHLAELRAAQEAEMSALQKVKKVLNKSRALASVRSHDSRPVGQRLHEEGVKSKEERFRLSHTSTPSWERRDRLQNPVSELTFHPIISPLAQRIVREGDFNFERIVDYNGRRKARRARRMEELHRAKIEEELSAPFAFQPEINPMSIQLAERRERKEAEQRKRLLLEQAVLKRAMELAEEKQRRNEVRMMDQSFSEGENEQEAKEEQRLMSADSSTPQQPQHQSHQQIPPYETPATVRAIYTDICLRAPLPLPPSTVITGSGYEPSPSPTPIAEDSEEVDELEEANPTGAVGASAEPSPSASDDTDNADATTVAAEAAAVESSPSASHEAAHEEKEQSHVADNSPIADASPTSSASLPSPTSSADESAVSSPPPQRALPPRPQSGYWQVLPSGVARWNELISSADTSAPVASNPSLTVLSARRFQRAKDIFSVLDANDRDGLISAAGGMASVSKLHPNDRGVVAALLRRIHQQQLHARAERFLQQTHIEGQGDLASIEESEERLRMIDANSTNGPPQPVFTLPFSDFLHLFLHELHLMATGSSSANINYDLLREPLPALAPRTIVAPRIRSGSVSASGSRATSRRGSASSATGSEAARRASSNSTLYDDTQSSRSRSVSREAEAGSRPTSIVGGGILRSASVSAPSSRPSSRGHSRSNSNSASDTHAMMAAASSALHAANEASSSTLRHLQQLAGITIPTGSSGGSRGGSAQSSPKYALSGSMHQRQRYVPSHQYPQQQLHVASPYQQCQLSPQQLEYARMQHHHQFQPHSTIPPPISIEDQYALELAHADAVSRSAHLSHRANFEQRQRQIALAEEQAMRAEWARYQQWVRERDTVNITGSPISEAARAVAAAATSASNEPSLETLSRMRLTGGSDTEASPNTSQILHSRDSTEPDVIAAPAAASTTSTDVAAGGTTVAVTESISTTRSVEEKQESISPISTTSDTASAAAAGVDESTQSPSKSAVHAAALRQLDIERTPIHSREPSELNQSQSQQQQQHSSSPSSHVRPHLQPPSDRWGAVPRRVIHSAAVGLPRSASSVIFPAQMGRQHFPERNRKYRPEISPRSQELAKHARAKLSQQMTPDLHARLHQQAFAMQQQRSYVTHAHKLQKQRRFAEENVTPYNK
jgi:hypothetical protein